MDILLDMLDDIQWQMLGVIGTQPQVKGAAVFPIKAPFLHQIAVRDRICQSDIKNLGLPTGK